MAKAKLDLFGIVLVGRQNPQILNHDFLVHNNVLPANEPFVRSDLKDGEAPFTEFVSAPPFARISYGKISLLVQEDRYQATDETGNDPLQSPISSITRKYFGDLLKFTPLKLAGVNINYRLGFDNSAEEQAFDANVGFAAENMKRAFDCPSVMSSMTAEIPFLEGRLAVIIAKSREPDQPARVIFNYEFGYPGQMDEFLTRLDGLSELVKYHVGFFNRLGIVE